MRKLKYSRVVTIIIFLYIIAQFTLNIFAKSIDTLVLENERIELKLSSRGLVIRDEYVIYSNSSGQVEMFVEEGEKVAKSQEIATIYSDKKDIDKVKEVEALNNEIDELKNGEKNISNEDISNLNEEIEIISNRIQDNLLNKSYDKINEDKELVYKLINERNRLLNNDIDSKNLQTKENKKEILSTQLEKNTIKLTSEISGIASYKFDGYEENYDVDKLNYITKKDIDTVDNKYIDIKSNSNDNSVKSKDPILRLIDNKQSFVAIYVDKNQKDKFELNQKVKLSYKNNEVNAKIDNIYEDGNNNIIIFKITDQNIGIYDTRVEEFDIIYKQIEGLKIPKKSIETIDGIQGVYVVNPENNKSTFVEIKGIVYEDKEHVYIDYYTNKISNTSSVNLYDEIILKPNSISTNIKIK